MEQREIERLILENHLQKKFMKLEICKACPRCIESQQEEGKYCCTVLPAKKKPKALAYIVGIESYNERPKDCSLFMEYTVMEQK